MPDLVGDPRLANVNQPSGPNPLHDDDPSNDDQYEAWKANADLWREWAAKQDEAIARLVQQGAASGQSAEQTLAKAGFKNQKEQGMHAYTMYGTGGYYSQMGAAADPGWRYDWNTGLKYNMGTDDLSARTRGVPINANEYAERQKAQQYAAQGVNDYGMQANSEAFKRAVSAGHFRQDPKTGNFYSGGSPTDPANKWVDKYGRAINSNTGLPTGQSFNGSALYGGGGGSAGGGDYGSSAFGGGAFGPGYSPGQEASQFSQADLNSALAESMRNDVLGQQMQLQKGLEGHALGTGIYDYMLNNVYGKILGANFSGNPQGVSQYTQGLQQGTPTTYSVGGDGSYGTPQSTVLGTLNNPKPQTGGNQTGTSGEIANTGDPRTITQGDIDNFNNNSGQIASGLMGAGGAPLDQGALDNFNGQVANGQIQTLGGSNKAAPGSTYDPQTALNASNMQTTAASRSGLGGLIDRLKANAAAQTAGDTGTGKGSQDSWQLGDIIREMAKDDPAMQAAIDKGPSAEDAKSIQNVLQYMQEHGMLTPEEYARRSQQLQQQMQAKANPGQPVKALGTPLPQGSYTQTGVTALDPNMNSTWASFLAPTFNQTMKAGDREQEAIRRALPRGGAQDRAISDSISNRYSSMQNAWQSLVPTALQGVSDIGKEMYFQQPAANSGAAGTAAGINAANQQYNLGLQGIKSNEKIAEQTNKSNFWGNLGGAALGVAGTLIKSDERTKKDVQPFASDLDDVTQMKPVSYKYNGKMGSKKDQPGVSVMAQDAKKIDPKMTGKMPGGALGVKPMEMLMKTVNSVKELKQIVAQLQQRLG